MPTDPNESKKKYPAASADSPRGTPESAAPPPGTVASEPTIAAVSNDAAAALQRTVLPIAAAIQDLTQALVQRLPTPDPRPTDDVIRNRVASLHQNLFLDPSAVAPFSNSSQSGVAPRS
jgi:hypothetical protein